MGTMQAPTVRFVRVARINHLMFGMAGRGEVLGRLVLGP